MLKTQHPAGLSGGVLLYKTAYSVTVWVSVSEIRILPSRSAI